MEEPSSTDIVDHTAAALEADVDDERFAARKNIYV